MRKLLIIGLLFHLISFGQPSRWSVVIHGDIDAIGNSLTLSYDNGYLVTGKFGHNYVHYNWLLKTDINGQFLWEKVFGEESSYINLPNICQNSNGQIFLSGTTTHFDPYRDPIVIKLNACGEKEWCRVFYTPENYDYSRYVLSTEDGGCIVLLNNTGPDSNYYGVRVALAKLNAGGELIWQQSYNSPDTCLQAEIIVAVLKTPDSGYLLTGLCDYEDPNYPGLFWTHPYYIKFDSLGYFQWETVVNKEIPEIGGAAWSTVINPNSTCFYSSISHYYHSPNSSAPALLKMDFDGNVIAIYDVVSGFKEGKLNDATFINDSTLAASAGWGNTEDSIWSWAVIIDTLGNLLNSRILIKDLYTSYLQVTHDGKLVYLSNTFQNNQFDCYLTKLNQNLEDDTLYTFPFTYDSLCPYQIVSDTIVQDDCGLIVGIADDDKIVGRYDGMKVGMEVWPNPASEVVRFVLESQQKVGQLDSWQLDKLSIEIYDIFGRIVQEINVRDGQNEVLINVSAFSPGIYIAILKNDPGIMESRKFVVVH